MGARKALLAAVAASMLLLVAGMDYAQSGADEDVSAPDRGRAHLRESAETGRAAAEKAALEAVPGTVHEVELETGGDSRAVYDVEVAGDDGENHEVKVDAGSGEIVHQDLEDETDDSDAGETDDLR